jgi:hypothetical protein
MVFDPYAIEANSTTPSTAAAATTPAPLAQPLDSTPRRRSDALDRTGPGRVGVDPSIVGSVVTATVHPLTNAERSSTCC